MDIPSDKFDRLVKQAKQLGLEGLKIQKYVDDAIDKELRVNERMAESKKKMEHDEALREQELKYKKEKAELEFKLKQEEQDHRQEMERKSLLLKEKQLETTGTLQLPQPNSKQFPKLPIFDEEKDEIDSFLFRFEAHAKACDWPEANWPIQFAAVLKGPSLSFYQSLCTEGVPDYATLKTQFLKKYACTEEGFRERLRSIRPEAGQSFHAHYIKIKHLWDRWIDLSKCEKTFEGISDLMIREQILQSVSRDLNVYLREKNLKSSKEISEAAELYMEARPGCNIARKDKPSLFSASIGLAQTGNYHKDRFSAQNGDQRRSLSHQAFQPKSKNTQFNSFKNPKRFFPTNGQPRNQFYPSAGEHRDVKSHVQPKGREQGLPHSPHKENSQRVFPSQTQKSGSETLSGHTLTCQLCDRKGHSAKQCRDPAAKQQSYFAKVGFADATPTYDLSTLDIFEGKIDGKKVSILRDSGCTTAGIRKSLVKSHQLTGENKQCLTFSGKIEVFPLAKINIETPVFSGELECCVLDDPVTDVILGNVDGVPRVDPFPKPSIEAACQVTTRAQAKERAKPTVPLPTPLPPDINVDREQLIKSQHQDDSLSEFFRKAQEGVSKKHGKGTCQFVVDGDVLFRIFNDGSKETRQVVVPKDFRQTLLFTAHDSILAGHGGTKRTLCRLLPRFWWPGLRCDVKDYCKTCDVCQKTIPKGKVKPVFLGEMPLIDTPFKRIAIDLVGPFKPVSKNGYQYILTIVDVATRFPEAIPLRKIDTESVAEALMSVFSRVGFPDELLSDRGTQFASDLMKEFCRLCSIQQIHSSPYHPIANGQVERFNGVLKTMLRKVVHDRPENWDRYIAAILFAYREMPNESTGFSPFELVYGRQPRGPMDLLYKSWSGKSDDDETKPLFHYILDLKNTLSDSMEIAQGNIMEARRKAKKYYDQKAVHRSFNAGDQVLVLRPTDHSKLRMAWQGPFQVLEELGNDYRIRMPRKNKIFHANMLQKYHERFPPKVSPAGNCVSEARTKNDETFDEEVSSQDKEQLVYQATPNLDREVTTHHITVETAMVGVVHQQEDEGKIPLPGIPSVKEESIKDVKFGESLSPAQKKDLKGLLETFSDILTDKPGKARDDIVHEINLISNEPVKLKPYPLPFASLEVVKREVETMLELGVIEPSRSNYSSPIVLVSKPDGSVRFCIDFRSLNKLTVLDAEPIPDPEELFCRLSGAQYFTKIDLAKGYWQIPVKEEDKPKTAFQTPLGLFQWNRMPFGLVSAPASFARMMRHLHLEKHSALNFFDDILVASSDWTSHLKHVEGVLSELKSFGLTIRPSKLFAGFQELEFLGHVVSQDAVQPENKKIKKILEIKTPQTRKQVRSLLGLIGYYRKFVPHFSSLTASLSDLTKDSSPKKVVWTEDCEKSLREIQKILSERPILVIPDLERPFIVRTDASSTGLGAVLLQEREGLLHPVCFVSRKLLDRETRYSTIERECLAIVWALTKLHRYLWRREFILQTDHKPLQYLTSKVFKNGRITRWALALQEFKFRIESVKGADNCFADCLSRCLTE